MLRKEFRKIFLVRLEGSWWGLFLVLEGRELRFKIKVCVKSGNLALRMLGRGIYIIGVFRRVGEVFKLY